MSRAASNVIARVAISSHWASDTLRIAFFSFGNAFGETLRLRTPKPTNNSERAGVLLISPQIDSGTLASPATSTQRRIKRNTAGSLD